MKGGEQMEYALRSAIQSRLKEIIDEELKAANDRITQRITVDSSEMAIAVLRHLSFDGDGEISIRIKPR